ncbi:hypothetical protein [Lactobacillus amylolyticus]|uniref:hypothetical protein n=1 Tax=Lactobacillus amylolyticus TaxID=83683 RepID=UPI000FCAD7D5|nr:hypothetical protein [Lactobacillus amylolyticus]
MIRDDTRQTIKFIIWVIVIAILLYIASIFVFFRAGSIGRDNDRQIAQIARQKAAITNVQTYYHLDRGVSSYALKGTDSKGKTYYFVYLPKTKKAYLYQASKGTSQSKIKSTFTAAHKGATIKGINLGWYQNNPVWEVAYQNSKGNLGYTLYDFKTGKAINEVDNL